MKQTYVPIKELGMPIAVATRGAIADSVTVLAVAIDCMDIVEIRA